ncbi:DNA polymerase III subunit epsilon [Acinetobacter sp. WZC-1]|uniref:DNA polymerase III subunit epsilon n=1 Tax=Acinetobacter sp. WZC-1 TaxID=3459034 RepID=UPI00403E10A3
MAQTITLYVDGACKGNPGPGGWGAYIITETEMHKLYGGEPETTNNRMELTAAIEGIAFCPVDAALIIWTDSSYVKRGITEWISGWKKKNWKDVKNTDLWKKLDAICQNREIEWHWIKGHAGHEGNEMADQLANLGVTQLLEQGKNAPVTTQKPLTTTELTAVPTDKKKEDDWLLSDPFGLDLMNAELPEPDTETTDDAGPQDPAAKTQPPVHMEAQVVSIANPASSPNSKSDATPDSTPGSESSSAAAAAVQIHPQIVISPANLKLQGPRQLILDTETTGFYYQDGDRIIEVGAIEMINRKLTGGSIHIYINPEKPVGDSVEVHGISDDFLKDKPKYHEIAQTLFDWLKGSEIIAHNASFDMNFLDMEFKQSGLPALSEVCTVTDTLAMAKSKHPGQKNSLDALVRRYEIVQRDRTFHGALLDAEILSDVYLAMTGGQVSLDIDTQPLLSEQQHAQNLQNSIDIELPVIPPSDEELQAHEDWIRQFQEKNGEACLFAK